mgnify:CR=1 FL=1
MRVHLTAASSVVLEDVGFSLELRARAGSPGTVEVLSYPPGSTTQPALDPDEHFIEAFGCLGLVELANSAFLPFARLLAPPFAELTSSSFTQRATSSSSCRPSSSPLQTSRA